jgi:hypothetical protein
MNEFVKRDVNGFPQKENNLKMKWKNAVPQDKNVNFII